MILNFCVGSPAGEPFPPSRETTTATATKMSTQEFDQLAGQTAEIIQILSASTQVNLSLSGDLAYLLMCQLDLAFHHEFNQEIGIPPRLWEFYLQLRGEVVQRCPQVSPFLCKYNVN